MRYSANNDQEAEAAAKHRVPLVRAPADALIMLTAIQPREATVAIHFSSGVSSAKWSP